MRWPKHIRDLASLGKTFADLTNFRRRLEPYRITCCWNDRLRVWILFKCNRNGAPGPDTVSLKVGPEALAGIMDDPEGIARDFERILNCEGVTCP